MRRGGGGITRVNQGILGFVVGSVGVVCVVVAVVASLPGGDVLQLFELALKTHFELV
jgi:hypothetical protein